MARLAKALIVNPPADGIYFRDLYHTFSSKASYVWQPADLLILSGALGRAYHVMMRDCIGERMSANALVNSLDGAGAFDVIVFLVGSITLASDMAAIERLRRRDPHAIIIAVGDFVREKGAQFLEECPSIDACLMDITADNLLDVLQNFDALDAAKDNFVIRTRQGALLEGRIAPGRGPFSIHLPHHESFDLGRYAQPVNRNLPVATVLGSFGCPFKCGFCAQGAIAFRTRPAQEIFRELVFLKEMGVREVMFRDQLLEGNRRNLRELCQLMIDADLDLTWYGNSRADTLDEELIDLMRRAGCHSVMMGIETSNDRVLADLKTRKSGLRTLATTALLRRAGISVHGYFILGLPGEDRSSLEDTIRLACSLDLDFASFATPSPDYGTQLRVQAIDAGLLDAQPIANTDRSVDIAGLNPGLPAAEVERLRRRAYRSFYFRPRTVFRIASLVGRRPRLARNVVRNLISMVQKQFLRPSQARA
jgi:anaerobic magnesium-protoporphyrin IX monomethyl ester cyclase